MNRVYETLKNNADFAGKLELDEANSNYLDGTAFWKEEDPNIHGADACLYRLTAIVV